MLLRQSIALWVSASLAAAVLAGCGAKSDSTNTPPVTPAPATISPSVPAPNVPYPTTACAAGTLSTQYGCLSQGNCPTNQALYNGQCIPGYATQPYAPGNVTGIPYGPYNPNYNPGNYSGYPTYPTTPGFPTYPIRCQPGYGFHAQYGCIPQSNCGMGYGNYSGNCVPAICGTTGGSWYGATWYATGSCPTGYSWFGGFCGAIYSEYQYRAGWNPERRCKIKRKGILTYWYCK